MFFKTIAVAAMTLGIASASFAQSSDSGSGGQGDSPMQMWTGEIGDTFFSDPAAGKMREAEDVKARWAKLSMADQEKVKTDCMAMKAETTGGMAEACKWVKSM